MIKKAKDIVGYFVRTLRCKSLSISQLVYVNNMYIVPKLAYMLQATKLTEASIDRIHQPIVRLIKNKIGLPATAGNYIVTHQGLGCCRSLSQELFSKQVVCLQNRLNRVDQVGKMTRIRLNEGYILAGLVKESWPKSQNHCLKKI